MALRHYRTKQGLSLPGLIDIIFLLLVFAIVKLTGYGGGAEPVDTPVDGRIPLEGIPKINVYQAGAVADITTVTIQIENFVTDEPPSSRRLILLTGTKNEPVSYAAAMGAAAEAERIWPLPEAETIAGLSFDRLIEIGLFQSISDSIISNIRTLYPEDDLSNYIEIRAVQNTEFRIIDFILKTCARLEDRVPLMSVCVLHEYGE